MSGFPDTASFVASLSDAQRRFFLERETASAALLQAAVQSLSRGLSTIAALHGEALNTAISARAQASRGGRHDRH